MLKELHAAVLGAKDQAQGQQTEENLQLVLERITATVSYAREPDFAMSDFTRFNFEYGNFGVDGNWIRAGKISVNSPTQTAASCGA